MRDFWAQLFLIMRCSKWLLIVLMLCSTVIRAADLPDGELPGRFAVNADGGFVCFSQGNLTYTASTDSWAFAEHQYDMVGNANLVGNTLADKIDLFGWSGDLQSPPNYGRVNSSSTLQFMGNFVDWGKNNIANGGKKWRTLTADEWSYLLENHSQFPTRINGVSGIAIMPQGVKLDIKPDSYTLEQWAIDEGKGVIFLPFAGYREGQASSVTDLNVSGFYWTATPESKTEDPQQESAFIVRAKGDKASVMNTSKARSRGAAVRLVKDKSACTVPVKVHYDAEAGSITITQINDEE